MALAGYDPRAAHDLWDLMSAVEQDNVAQGQAISVENRFALLRTHPPSDVRQEVRLLPQSSKLTTGDSKTAAKCHEGFP
jgi:predicted Zn-dependent protease